MITQRIQRDGDSCLTKMARLLRNMLAALTNMFHILFHEYLIANDYNSHKPKRMDYTVAAVARRSQARTVLDTYRAILKYPFKHCDHTARHEQSKHFR